MNKTLKAESAVYGGFSIAHEEGIIFIKGAVPGELVEIEVIEKKKDYSVAKVIDILEPSESRIEPACRYFNVCGGCQLQYVSYERQIAMKDDVLNDCLKRLADVDIMLDPSITGEPYNYRRRAQFKVSREGKIGFYREDTRDVVDIEACPLMHDDINKMLGRIRLLELQNIKEIHITCGDSLLAYIKGKGYDSSIAEKFMEIGFAGVVFEDGSYRGARHTGFDLDGLAYTVSSLGFMQGNWELNVRVVQAIEEALKPLDGRRVLDFYAGGGNFSLKLAASGAKVVAVEENPDSSLDGERNLTLNAIKNMRFVTSKAEKARLQGQFDVILLDPPRPGLTNDAMQRVLEMKAGRIVYVSCNPATFARDLKKLKADYQIDSIRMVDFFPNTYHVESLAFLTRLDKPMAPVEEGVVIIAGGKP